MTSDKSAVAIRYLTSENAFFHASPGGLLAMTLRDGSTEHDYDRVIVLRSFPITSPDEFLSVREPKEGKKEIGMIRHLSDLDEASEALVAEELARRYFVPKILKIHSLRRRGAVYVDAETDVGRRLFLLRDDVSSIRLAEDGRVFFTDMEGNSYVIEDPTRLDRASYRRISIFL